MYLTLMNNNARPNTANNLFNPEDINYLTYALVNFITTRDTTDKAELQTFLESNDISDRLDLLKDMILKLMDWDVFNNAYQKKAQQNLLNKKFF